MNIKTFFSTRLLCAVILSIPFISFATVSNAEAQFPEKPIKIVVGFGAGGGTDTLARLVAAELEKDLGQPVIVENKPGGGGIVAANKLKQVPADGYTIGMAVSSTFSLAPLLSKK